MQDEEIRILLIEDNPGDARLIEEMLRGRNVRLPRAEEGVTGRTNGEAVTGTTLLKADRLAEGLTLLEEQAIDVLLLDLGLPDSTGLETLKTTLDHTDDIPIVVLTGLDDETVGVQAVQQGAQSYLRKDELGGELLLRSIRHALERYERERQLTSLTTLSQDLMAATTAEEIARLTVSAASDVLGFPVAMVCLYDSDRGNLQPRAATDQGEELLFAEDGAPGTENQIAPSLSEACRTVVGEAFATNRAVVDMVSDEDSDLANEESGLQSRVVLPLAAHGVVLVGSTTAATVASTSVDYAKMLATNTQAALDRLARERQLRERESTLERQTESLERLNRINAVIRDVVQGVVHATTRSEIEQAVCDRLATAGPYRFVWIGAHDQLQQRVTPRASAGVEDGYLDSIATSTAGRADQSPVERAVSTRETQVVDDAVTDVTSGPWREAALKRGYRSIASMPLVYSETLYGVLTVYADQPGIFESDEVAVLTELAETVAHAVNAVESKRALIGDRVVELEFEVRDEQLFFVELTDALGCTFDFESVVPRSDDRLRLFFTTRGADVEAVRSFGEQALVVEELALVTEREDDCVFECTLREPNLISFCLDHGVTVQSITAENGTARAVFELANDASVRSFAEQFQSTYPETTLLASREDERSVQTRQSFQSRLEEDLTARQAEVLRTAFFSGYFESPRASSGRDLAAKLDIAQPTMNQHLRTAMRKLLSLLYAE